MRAAYYLIYLSICVCLLALIAPGMAEIQANPAVAAFEAGGMLSPVQRIRAGDINCVNCDLTGADLSNQCVKNGDLRGAKLDEATARYMCMSYADFANASFRHADLTGANLAHANLDGADLTGANLTIASIKGANLATAKGLTQAQLDAACGDAETRLPPGLAVHSCL